MVAILNVIVFYMAKLLSWYQMSYTYANTQKIINNDQYLNQLNCLHSTQMFIIYILLYYIYIISICQLYLKICEREKSKVRKLNLSYNKCDPNEYNSLFKKFSLSEEIHMKIGQCWILKIKSLWSEHCGTYLQF